ncbi:Phosphoglucomutase-2 [Chamberlinius hualienensis]
MTSEDPQLEEKIKEWLEWDKNDATRAEIKSLVQNADFDTLRKLLLTRLTFGTAGLRGIMSAGYGRMNDLVLIQTSQGLAKYIVSTCPDTKSKGVVIGFDGRHNSERFAALTARAFISNEIPVYLYSKMVPTPFIPYGVVKFGAIAGIMVTASHNPKEDNGYKVYWTNGAQIIEPHDKGIQSSIVENLEPAEHAWDYDSVKSHPLVQDPLSQVMETYFKMLHDEVIYREINETTSIKFTFTPMHGVGYPYMLEAFKSCALPPFFPVKEQIEPDPEFPTVKFPNPEEGKSALDLSFETAKRHGSDVILANDPDADRLAVAELLPSGEWKVFTGNETGALLGWWMWHRFSQQHPDINPDDVYMIASTVSSKMLRAIAKKEGFHFIETLTGFKWMGNKAHELLQNGKTVLFAYEEAIGFMCGVTVLDKDGVNAAVKMAELAAYLRTKGSTLTQYIGHIYEEYGYHVSRNSYYICYEQPTIVSMFERLRNYNGPNTYPKECGPFPIKSVRDLTTGFDSSFPDNKAILPFSKSSQMITFTFENGCVATLRTSGTEPKIKYYTELCAQPDKKNWGALDLELETLVKHIVEEFMEPTKNQLIPRSD